MAIVRGAPLSHVTASVYGSGYEIASSHTEPAPYKTQKDAA